MQKCRNTRRKKHCSPQQGATSTHAHERIRLQSAALKLNQALVSLYPGDLYSISYQVLSEHVSAYLTLLHNGKQG